MKSLHPYDPYDLINDLKTYYGVAVLDQVVRGDLRKR